MGRSLQIGYSGNARPYGQPADDSQEYITEFVGGRNVTRVPDYLGEIAPASSCVTPTKSGNPCKAPPVSGTDTCVFHGG
jgi:hypothetical protein